MKGLWRAREFSTVVILLVEVLFFTWYLWPEAGRSHPFLNAGNFLLIFKYSSIYGIAAMSAGELGLPEPDETGALTPDDRPTLLVRPQSPRPCGRSGHPWP